MSKSMIDVSFCIYPRQCLDLLEVGGLLIDGETDRIAVCSDDMDARDCS